MTKKLDERLLDSVGALLGLFVVNEERFPSAEGQMRYNPIDFQTLRFLENNPNSKGVDIARAIGVAPTTLQSALDRLIRNGLVARQNHPDSKRAKAHNLTTTGRKVRAAIHRQDMANMNVMLEALSPSERKEIVRLIEKVRVHLDAL